MKNGKNHKTTNCNWNNIFKLQNGFTTSLKKLFLQPILAMFGDELNKLDDDEREELERELDNQVMPQLQDAMDMTRVVFNTWIIEEVTRIYANA